MTTGEKIRFFRKKLNLSQEELGKKLLVSRQTISLWEMDKTIPTIENLSCLKDIFSTTIDNLINNDIEEIETEEPLETYTFQYTLSEFSEVKKDSIKIQIPGIIILTSVIAVLIFAGINLPDIAIFTGIVSGVFGLIDFIFIHSFILTNKAWIKKKEAIPHTSYNYLIYDDYFKVTINKADNSSKTMIIYYSDIIEVKDLGEFYLYTTDDYSSFLIRKEQLDKHKSFYNFFYEKYEKEFKGKVPLSVRSFSILLCALSFFSIWIAIICYDYLLSVFQHNPTWVFAMFSLIPLGSIAFGIYMKKKGWKHRKNIITGIIMFLILILSALAPFLSFVTINT